MTGLYIDPRSQAAHPQVGTGNLETRIIQLEMHSYYAQKEREVLAREIDLLHQEIDEIERDRAALARRLGLWIIGALGTALMTVLWNLVLPALSGAFPRPG